MENNTDDVDITNHLSPSCIIDGNISLVKDLLLKCKVLENEHFIYGLPVSLVACFTKEYISQNICIDRVSFKVLYSVTDSSGKYGNKLSLLLLDGEPICFFTQGCKWLDTYVLYLISDELFNKFKSFVDSFKENEVEYMEKCLADGWFKEFLVDVPTFPYKQIERDY